MRSAIFLLTGTLLAATASTSYLNEAARWRADYERSLKAPGGWLSVAGLFWLKPGDNKLTVGTPPQTVVFRFANKTISCQGKRLKPDSDDKIDIAGVTLQPIERDGNYGIRMRDPNAQT